jgi:hypothetical protein
LRAEKKEETRRLAGEGQDAWEGRRLMEKEEVEEEEKSDGDCAR